MPGAQVPFDETEWSDVPFWPRDEDLGYTGVDAVRLVSVGKVDVTYHGHESNDATLTCDSATIAHFNDGHVNELSLPTDE